MNITEICADIRNYFPPVNQRHDMNYIHRGTFTISGGSIVPSDFIKPNQYFRIVGSTFNDGVYQNTTESLKELTEEKFDGSIWLMAVPRDFINLCKEIDEWKAKYETVNSLNMSPFTSEDYTGVYGYTKASSSSSGGGNYVSWKNQFASRLNTYRRLNVF